AQIYPNLSLYGLISCETTLENIPTKSQNEIRTFLAADPKTKIYVDGFLLMNDHYRIATNSIKEIELISPNEAELNTAKIINVWTLTKENRLGYLAIDRNAIQKRNSEN
ncbi:hypothetical protein, partial [Kaistella sp.]|uniref:hypothetical protein n=1 Tax=Kaistella sp. TaxID=2782235 RepID=UPI003C64FEDE